MAEVGVLTTPRNYCVELPTPTGFVVTIVALVAAGIAATATRFVRIDSLVTLGIVLVTFTGIGVVAYLASRQQVNWSCG